MADRISRTIRSTPSPSPTRPRASTTCTGATGYYLIPTERLPLLQPMAQLGVPSPILAVGDAPLRVLVETGYDRTISPGEPTPAMWLYFPDPLKTGQSFIIAIPTGMDDGADEAVNIRPFGTPPPDQRSPYGVGGPPADAGTFTAAGSPAPATPDASVTPDTADPAPVRLIQGPGVLGWLIALKYRG